MDFHQWLENKNKNDNLSLDESALNKIMDGINKVKNSVLNMGKKTELEVSNLQNSSNDAHAWISYLKKKQAELGKLIEFIGDLIPDPVPRVGDHPYHDPSVVAKLQKHRNDPNYPDVNFNEP